MFWSPFSVISSPMHHFHRSSNFLQASPFALLGGQASSLQHESLLSLLLSLHHMDVASFCIQPILVIPLNARQYLYHSQFILFVGQVLLLYVTAWHQYRLENLFAVDFKICLFKTKVCSTHMIVFILFKQKKWAAVIDISFLHLSIYIYLLLYVYRRHTCSIWRIDSCDSRMMNTPSQCADDLESTTPTQ